MNIFVKRGFLFLFFFYSCLLCMEENSSENCAICRFSIEGEKHVLSCKHEFHRNCIIKHYNSERLDSKKPSCPLCRQNYEINVERPKLLSDFEIKLYKTIKENERRLLNITASNRKNFENIGWNIWIFFAKAFFIPSVSIIPVFINHRRKICSIWGALFLFLGLSLFDSVLFSLNTLKRLENSGFRFGACKEAIVFSAFNLFRILVNMMQLYFVDTFILDVATNSRLSQLYSSVIYDTIEKLKKNIIPDTLNWDPEK